MSVELLELRDVAALWEALQDDSPEVRATAAAALVRLPLSREAWPHISDRIGRVLDATTDRGLRDALIDSAGRIPTTSMRRRLAGLVEAADDADRLAATLALARRGDDAAFEPLLGRISEHEGLYQVDAAEHLAMLDVSGHEHAVRAVGERVEVPAARFWIGVALARAGETDELESGLADLAATGPAGSGLPDLPVLEERVAEAGPAPRSVINRMEAVLGERGPGYADGVAQALVIGWYRWASEPSQRTGGATDAERLEPVSDEAGHQEALHLAERYRADALATVRGDVALPDQIEMLRRLDADEFSSLVSDLFAQMAKMDDHRVAVGNVVCLAIAARPEPFLPDVEGMLQTYVELLRSGARWDSLAQVCWSAASGGASWLVAGVSKTLVDGPGEDRVHAARLIADAARFLEAPDPVAHGGEAVRIDPGVRLVRPMPSRAGYVPAFAGEGPPPDVPAPQFLLDDEPEDEHVEPSREADRRISIWISGRDDADDAPLGLDEEHTMAFQVGPAQAGSLVPADDASSVPGAGLPADGLSTDWVVTADGIELLPAEPETTVSQLTVGRLPRWVARFSLRIPQEGESEERRLRLIPHRGADPSLRVTIYSGVEVYRQLSVRLHLEGTVAQEAAVVDADFMQAPVSQLGLTLSYAHETRTPPGMLSIVVQGAGCLVKGTGSPHEDETQWYGTPGDMVGPIKWVRKAADDFRVRFAKELDAIDPDHLERRLGEFRGEIWNETNKSVSRADPAHERAWGTQSTSVELRRLAHEGRHFYDTVFPPGRTLRGYVDSLEHGARLAISWPRNLPGAALQVPWALMYLPDPPAEGEPVDPIGFLGLRFRISFMSYPAQVESKALGDRTRANQAYFMLWGKEGHDAVAAAEVQWQRRLWADGKNRIFLPAADDPQARKREVVKALDEPLPAPVTLLYLYCHWRPDTDGSGMLRFGDTNGETDVVTRLELGYKQLADHPLVFANACESSATPDALVGNPLEGAFFRRKCRAYIGTETKVPMVLASRFASIFFHLLNGNDDDAPMAAGEAFSQARRFLWTDYRNLGGLLYTYVNQYELFAADDSEVR